MSDQRYGLLCAFFGHAASDECFQRGAVDRLLVLKVGFAGFGLTLNFGGLCVLAGNFGQSGTLSGFSLAAIGVNP